ncbi:DUF1697 domain-containing protein [Agromyces intestinalis]|uniref:DUF1697 domain-containing protein n=1 Tax=Agromyces intestinalis TaxID=2592652 RepID=A0A5C1YH51_9MICO|nr:DUF1697 domain-containing protein [Agromyces intestinalis]QEO14938.1 DUF1697 domain-containing protein [Agromyces intestinalis]
MTASTRFVALLRGINVGGRNAVRMPDLVGCFADAGFADVRTLGQSGNVVFTARRTSGARFEGDVAAMLEDRFGMPVPTVIRSRAEFARTMDEAPPGHGSPDLRADVFFCRHPLTPEQALAEMPELREGVDTIAVGPGALYFSRVAARATKTRIQKFMALPVFQQNTVRSWGTCVKVSGLLEED